MKKSTYQGANEEHLSFERNQKRFIVSQSCHRILLSDIMLVENIFFIPSILAYSNYTSKYYFD